MLFIFKSVVSGNIVFVCLFVWGLTPVRPFLDHIQALPDL